MQLADSKPEPGTGPGPSKMAAFGIERSRLSAASLPIEAAKPPNYPKESKELGPALRIIPAHFAWAQGFKLASSQSIRNSHTDEWHGLAFSWKKISQFPRLHQNIPGEVTGLLGFVDASSSTPRHPGAKTVQDRPVVELHPTRGPSQCSKKPHLVAGRESSQGQLCCHSGRILATVALDVLPLPLQELDSEVRVRHSYFLTRRRQPHPCLFAGRGEGWGRWQRYRCNRLVMLHGPKEAYPSCLHSSAPEKLPHWTSLGEQELPGLASAGRAH